ncbi:hypothetical protein J5N97_018305 [Dioscorea zingiberensis]|uniref:Fibronectin type III-like domain-containing protein n=1 Tax=Dioscorea zingiberensis TaxID=325984 RepID=A0A9D5CN13_9LILI|nr:hypothetical protein J5N97_018305 [Dioscorea zingiberensis]
MKGFPCPRLPFFLSKKLAAKRIQSQALQLVSLRLIPLKKSQLFRVSKASGTIPESKSLFFDKTHQKSLTLIDPDRICSILSSQKDWFLTLNSEFKQIALHLGSQSVVSVLQKQENPIFLLKFYVWVSDLDVKLAKDRFVRKNQNEKSNIFFKEAQAKGKIGRKYWRRCDDLLIPIHVDVKNEGDLDGSHVVLVFSTPPVSSQSAPMKQMVAFEKVHVFAKCQTRVTLSVDDDGVLIKVDPRARLPKSLTKFRCDEM